MSIDFSKQNNLQEKLELVRTLYKRFNDNYGNLIDMNIVEEAISNIVVANEDMSNIPADDKKLLENGMAAELSLVDNKIYIKNNTILLDLVHEILHYISKDHNGMIGPVVELYPDEVFAKNMKKFGEKRTVEQIAQLDESFTCFMAELIYPEFENKNRYRFGQKCIKKYYDGLTDNTVDGKFLFNAYINGDIKATKKFMDSFGDDFYDLIDVIEQNYNALYYIIVKKQKNPSMSEEQVDLMIKKAVLETKKHSMMESSDSKKVY